MWKYVAAMSALALGVSMSASATEIIYPDVFSGIDEVTFSNKLLPVVQIKIYKVAIVDQDDRVGRRNWMVK